MRIGVGERLDVGLEGNIRNTYIELSKGNVGSVYAEVDAEKKSDVGVEGVWYKKDCASVGVGGFNW